MRIIYFILSVVSGILILIAMFLWPFGSLTFLSWIAWITTVLGLVIYLKYTNIIHSSGWIALLLLAGIMFTPLFPVMKYGLLNYNHILAAVILVISGIKVLADEEEEIPE